MNWTIPGTVLQCPRQDAASIEERFSAMFLGGGIALSQVASITGLSTHDIQNWVKRGFLTAPEKKRYSLRQLCRILNINTLKCIPHYKTGVYQEFTILNLSNLDTSRFS